MYYENFNIDARRTSAIRKPQRTFNIDINTMPPQSTLQGRNNGYHYPPSVTAPAEERKKPAWWKLHVFLFILFLDTATAAVLLNPFIPK